MYVGSLGFRSRTNITIFEAKSRPKMSIFDAARRAALCARVTMVRLVVEGECDVDSGGTWEEVDHTQKCYDDDELICPESFADCEIGHVLALSDRNNLQDPWRRVWVVRGVDSACIFDEQGLDILEAARKLWRREQLERRWHAFG